MNTMQLACFLAVAETLNFARAAEQLHVTQPAVTQQIHALEGELNVRLFRRTTRSVELTQEGLLFLGDAKAILEIFERTKKRAQSAGKDTREPFLIGCHSNNDILHLAPVLQQMKELFPQLYPIFRVVPFQHLYQRLSEEAVDVVVAFQEGELRRAIHYQELAKIPVVGVGTPDSPLAEKGELTFGDFRQAPLIVLDPQKCPEGYRSLLHHVLEDRAPVEVYFCEAVESAVTLAQAGYGIAMLPDFFLNRTQSLLYLPVSQAEPISYGVYYKTLTGRSLRRTFLKLAKERFAPERFAVPHAKENAAPAPEV